MQGVEFQLTLTRAFIDKDRGGKRCVVGVASDDQVDLDNERMSLAGLQRMAAQCKKSVDILESHKTTFAIGRTFDAAIKASGAVNELEVMIELDDNYPQAASLFEEVRSGNPSKQMSIGGDINLSNPDAVSYEPHPGGKGVVRVFNDIVLDHIAMTRKSRAAVAGSRFHTALMKSLEGDADGPGPRYAEIPTAESEGHRHLITVALPSDEIPGIGVSVARPVFRCVASDGHTHEIDTLSPEKGVTSEVNGHRHEFDPAPMAAMGLYPSPEALDKSLVRFSGSTGVVKGPLGTSDHKHSFLLVYDLEGRLVHGMSSEVGGHSHSISHDDLLLGTTSDGAGHKHTIGAPSGVAKEMLQTFATADSAETGRVEKAKHGFARTSADPIDGHSHFCRVDESLNGITDVSGFPPHAHTIRNGSVLSVRLRDDYTSDHPGKVEPDEEMEMGSQQETGEDETPFSVSKDSLLGVPTAKKIVPVAGSKEAEMPADTKVHENGDFFANLARHLNVGNVSKEAPTETETTEVGPEVAEKDSEKAETAEKVVSVETPEKVVTAPTLDDALGVLAAFAQTEIPEDRREDVRSAAAALLRSVSTNETAEDFLSAAETAFSAVSKGSEERIASRVEKFAGALLEGLRQTVQKADLHYEEIGKELKGLGVRITEIEAIENGTGGKPEDVGVPVQKSRTDNGLFAGLFRQAALTALADMGDNRSDPDAA